MKSITNPERPISEQRDQWEKQERVRQETLLKELDEKKRKSMAQTRAIPVRGKL